MELFQKSKFSREEGLEKAKAIIDRPCRLSLLQ
jgi:hypothetical protein